MSTPMPPDDENPTTQLPPTGETPAQPGTQPPPPGTPGHAPHAAGPPKPKDPSLPWKIATGVLAVTTVGFGVWGIMTNSKLNDLQTQTNQQIAALQLQLQQAEANSKEQQTKDEAREKAQARQIEELRKKSESDRASLKLDTGKIQAQTQALKGLASEYKSAQAKAQQKEGSLSAQLAASQAESALAKKCAQVLGTGLLKIYSDVPTVVTYKQVNQVLNAASDSCGTVVQLNQ
ncbi:MAG: hypothetical protein U0R64_11215 [Candidatus Nanopelagicales bacterium]